MWAPVLWSFSGVIIFVFGMITGASIMISIKNAQTGEGDG